MSWRRKNRKSVRRGTRPPSGRIPGTRARGPAPEPSRLGRQLAIVPLVLAVLGSIYLAPHALEYGQVRIRQEPFLVAQLHLEGLDRVTSAELMPTLTETRGIPIVELDCAALAADLEAHPWIERASVRRRPPNELRIRVLERAALAVTAVDGHAGLHVVDASGTAFAPASETDIVRLVAIVLASPATAGTASPELLEGLHLAASFRARGLEVPRRVTLGVPHRAQSAEVRLRGFAPSIFIERGEVTGNLDRLSKLLKANIQEAMNARIIDLRFAGQAVLWSGT